MRSRIPLLSFILFCCSTTLASTFYVDASRPNDSGNGTSWATAKRTIQAAVNLTVAGDTVLVTNGIYNSGATVTPGGSLSNRLVVTKNITIQSVNGTDVTFIEGSGTNRYGTAAAVRCVYMTGGVLDGFTLRYGATSNYFNSAINSYGGGVYATNATLSNCTLLNNKAYYGGGSAFGFLTNCAFLCNSAGAGGGSAFGTQAKCTLSGNSAFGTGGGTYQGTLANCTVSGNSASVCGGGAYEGTLANCSLTENISDYAGGSFQSTLKNCIVWRNANSGGFPDNWARDTFTFSCSWPLPPGTGNISADPLFLGAEDGDFRLLPGSPCLNVGDNAAVSGATDLAGNARIQNGTVDMGAYEGVATPALAASTGVSASDGTYANKVRVVWGAVANATHYKVYRAPFAEAIPKAVCGWQTNLVFDDTSALPENPYQYWVKAATNAIGGGSSALSGPDSGWQAFAAVWYVNAARSDDSGEGTSWATAKKTIQAAVDAATTYDAILVTNGVYNTGATVTPGGTLSNRVVVTKAVTIKSVNGAESTFIEGSGTNRYGTVAAVRCIFMTDGTLDGFTLRYGTTRDDYGSTVNNSYGGGAYAPGASLRNCILTSNQAYRGGGISYGILTNCVLSNNTAYGGGGAHQGALANCTLTSNSANDFGGAAWSTLAACSFSNNSAEDLGGGAGFCKLANCSLTGNSAFSGGGVYYSTLANCTLSGNTASTGGGADWSTLTACTLTSNYSAGDGGGAAGGTLTACTLTSNSANSGGGATWSTLTACKLSNNSAATYGGGAELGTLTACTLSSNSATYGGGAAGGTLTACTLFDNFAICDAGGSLFCTLTNCTLTGNSASSSGGGAYYGSIYNSIVYGNVASISNNYYCSELTYSCSLPLPCGTGNIASDPLLTDKTHIATNSPCMNAGSFTYCSGTDIDGELWNNPPCIGCDQVNAFVLYIFSVLGGATPSGTTSNLIGATIDAWVTNSPLANGTTQYVCVGSSVVGNAFTQNSATNVTLILTNNATLTWNWQTLYLLTAETNGAGSVSGAGWYGTGSNAVLTATPAVGWHFLAWSGDTNGCTTEDSVLVVPMDRARSMIAEFVRLPIVSTPMFSPPSGTVFTNSIFVTIDCATEGAAIRYTLDDSDPTLSSALYTEPLMLDNKTTVKARAFKDDWADSVVASADYESFHTCYYVNASRPNDLGPGTSWATAKKTIQAAVNLTSAGDTVLVTNGTYNTGATVTPGGSLSNRVVITNDIMVRSVNGEAVTCIEGSGTSRYGTTAAVRCVFINNGVLDGFTLRYGATRNDSGSGINSYGGGAYSLGATLRNCTLTSNRAYSGGGTSYGDLSNCILSGNSAASFGGGVYGGSLITCTLTGNSANYGGGASHGTLVNCTLIGNTATGSGGGSYYGTLANCALTSNSAVYNGGGAFSGVLTTCTLVGNTAADSGGGAYYGSLANCALTGNLAAYNGGGTYYGSLVNCTLTGNSAVSAGGGTYNGTLKNCTVWENINGEGCPDNWYNGTFTNSCSYPLPSGTGNIAADPLFADAEKGDFRLLAGSPCLDAGDNSTVSGTTDLAGNTRIQNGTVDIGAYEGAVVPALPSPSGVFATDGTFADKVRVTWDTLEGATHYRVYRSRYAEGIRTAICSWQTNLVFDDVSALPEATYLYWVRASTNTLGGGTSALSASDGGWRAFCAKWYVNAARSDDSGDGTSWDTAKRTIQAAANAAADGDAILVTNGAYNTGATVTPGGTLSNRVVVTKAVTIKSVNGAEYTFIEGSGTNRYGTAAAVRCVFMTNGRLDGFTLRRGTTGSSSSSAVNNYGGGAYAHCATLSNCILTNNRAYSGGGSAYGTMTNCMLSGNSAASTGGGTYYGTQANCALSCNSTSIGGGAYYSTLANCTLSGNTASTGGGAYDGTLINCTLSDNSATSGGGAYYGTLANCTLSGNLAKYGGGTYYGTLRNCIIYYNTASSTSNNSYRSSLSYCCTTPLASGAGNITNAPLLVDAAHLAAGSPCIGAGSYAYCSGTDIDGEAWLNPPCMGCDQVYSMFALSIASALGGATPCGTVSNLTGTDIHAWVTNSPSASGATQYVCVGASVAGNAFTQNNATNVSLTLTNNATLTWLWQTNYWLATSAGAHGAVSVDSGWQARGITTQVTANADQYYHLDSWTGDADGTANPLSVLVDRPKSVTATFAPDMTATNPTPLWWLAQYGFSTDFEQAAQSDADGDGRSAWEEYVSGTVPTNSGSVFQAQIVVSNGIPQIAWTPDLGAARAYAVEGRTNLVSGAWAETNSDSRFFRVKVSLP